MTSYPFQDKRSSIELINNIKYSNIKLYNVENNGVEPLTYCVQGSRSSQLS